MRQRIAIRMSNLFLGWCGIPDEVTLSCGIAPRPFRIPVPGLNEKIGILPVADDSPTCGKNQLDLIGTEECVRGITGDAVDGGPEGVTRTKSIHWASSVDNYSLCSGKRRR